MSLGRVNLPNVRRQGGGCIAISTYLPVQPDMTLELVWPTQATRRAIEMTEAADIRSAAAAVPLFAGVTPRPAAWNSPVEPARARIAIPTLSAHDAARR